MKKHFLTLDSFRGICACIVAFSHFNANSIFNGSKILDRGDIYVDFFFVLSGFVIFANYREKLRAGFGVGKFVMLRFGRLYPLHLAVFLAFVLFDVLQLFLNVDGAALYPPFSAPGEDIRAMVANVLLIHSLNTIDVIAFNGPSWSISVEFYTYILFALVLVYSGRYYRQATLAVAALSAGWLYYLHGELYAKLDYGILRCLFGFACGGMAFEAYDRWKGRGQELIQNKSRINLIECLLMVVTLVYIGWFSYGPASMLAPLLFSLVIFVFAFEGGRISDALKIKPFLFVGMLSYSIYMVHIFISGKFFALPARLLENKLGGDVSVKVGDMVLLGTDKMTGTLLEIFYLMVVIGCSYISFKLIEEPCRRWTKKFVSEKMA